MWNIDLGHLGAVSVFYFGQRQRSKTVKVNHNKLIIYLQIIVKP